MMMQSITLPTGPFDRHPNLLPPAEFDARLRRFQEVMAADGVTHAVVHGNALDHGALTWLTGFTPKLGPAYALVTASPEADDIRILFSGGPGMRPSAERLTWVKNVSALKGLKADLTTWLSQSGADDGAHVGLCEGRAMSLSDWITVATVAKGQLTDLDGVVDRLRQRKSAVELALMMRAGVMLSRTVESLAASFDASHTLRASALAAERAAYAAGAQDIRLRIGRRAWAPPVVVEAEVSAAKTPLRAAIAVRHEGYWVCGRTMIGKVPATLEAAAATSLSRCLAVLRPGAWLADIAFAAGQGVTVQCGGIGLSLCELPDMAAADEPLAPGDVCELTLSLAVHDSPGHTAVWSAVAAVCEDAAQVIWAPPELTSAP